MFMPKHLAKAKNRFKNYMKKKDSLKIELMRHPVKTFLELVELFNMSRCLSNAVSEPIWPNFYRSIYLHFERQFAGKEIGDLGMCLEPFFSGNVDKYLSRREMTKLQEMVNPAQYAPFLKNKIMFYQHCLAKELPIPKLLAVYYKDGLGWTSDMRLLKNACQWKDFLLSCPSDSIVIKPSPGCGGEGLAAYRRKGGSFFDMQGKIYSAAQVFENTVGTNCEDGVVIQEYLYNHPDIASISNVDGRQCARLATFLDDNGNCRIWAAFIKFIVGDNVFDNFNGGTSGNIMAHIDINEGTICSAVTVDAQTRRLYNIERHPETQKNILGTRLPHWETTRMIACLAASAFFPIRAVCWDIIITPDGPFIVEGNIWWDPMLPNLFGISPEIRKQINESSNSNK